MPEVLDSGIQDTFYEDEVQDDGSLTQTVTLLQPLANSLPIFVFLMATQKTKATKTTIKVYSTKPWPSSSTNKRFKRSINDFTSFRQKWPCVHRESSLSIVCAPRSREALGELLRLLGMVAARYQRHYCPLRWWIRVNRESARKGF